jgi:hypothetical protein
MLERKSCGADGDFGSGYAQSEGFARGLPAERPLEVQELAPNLFRIAATEAAR